MDIDKENKLQFLTDAGGKDFYYSKISAWSTAILYGCAILVFLFLFFGLLPKSFSYSYFISSVFLISVVSLCTAIVYFPYFFSSLTKK